MDLALPPGRVSFMGPWPNSSIPAIIKESHLVVIPSRYENFCNVALEALAAGRAALGSRCGGLPDLIKPEFNGLLFEPASPPDLAVKLTRCFRNPDDVVAWGANGFEQSRRYGWEEVAEETHVLFVRIIARRAAEPTRGLEDGSRGDSRK